MTRDEAVIRIQDALGFRTDISDKIIARMQEAQRDLERGKTLPWFLLKEDQPIILPISTNTVTLPTDFLREVEDEPLRYFPTSSSVPYYIKRRRFDDGLTAFDDVEASGPKIYILRKDSLYFFPLSDAAYTLTWTYYARGASLSTNLLDGQSPWLDNRYVPELLIGRAGQKMARDLGDATAAAIFDQMLRDAWDAVFRETVVREQMDMPMQMGRNA